MNEVFEDGVDKKFKKNVWLDIWRELLKEKKTFVFGLVYIIVARITRSYK